MISNIQKAFSSCKKEKRPALLTYTVAGDPNIKTSLQILNNISKHADICEVGLPHNTPVADGGQIQNSSYRAIQRGITTKQVFQLIKQFKKNNTTPVILMGYFNTVFQYGENSFLKDCKASGVDGIIIVDLPWPENKKFSLMCKKSSVNFIQLISPTTSDKRMKQIIKDSHDMLYYISMLSTTGGKLKVSPKQILQNYSKIKKINPAKNIVIGFGITEKTISSLKKADGLVVGSALCKAITMSLLKKTNPVLQLNKMVKALKAKII